MEDNACPITKAAPFLKELWKILSEKRNGEIICWDDKGVTVEIHSRNRLAKEVLPRHFKSTKFASFQRQLCYFGFEKLAHTRDTGRILYANKSFKRSSPSLIASIERKTNTGNRRQKPQKQKGRGLSTIDSEGEEVEYAELEAEAAAVFAGFPSCSMSGRRRKSTRPFEAEAACCRNQQVQQHYRARCKVEPDTTVEDEPQYSKFGRIRKPKTHFELQVHSKGHTPTAGKSKRKQVHISPANRHHPYAENRVVQSGDPSMDLVHVLASLASDREVFHTDCEVIRNCHKSTRSGPLQRPQLHLEQTNFPSPALAESQFAPQYVESARPRVGHAWIDASPVPVSTPLLCSDRTKSGYADVQHPTSIVAAVLGGMVERVAVANGEDGKIDICIPAPYSHEHIIDAGAVAASGMCSISPRSRSTNSSYDSSFARRNNAKEAFEPFLNELRREGEGWVPPNERQILWLQHYMRANRRLFNDKTQQWIENLSAAEDDDDGSAEDGSSRSECARRELSILLTRKKLDRRKRRVSDAGSSPRAPGHPKVAARTKGGTRVRPSLGDMEDESDRDDGALAKSEPGVSVKAEQGAAAHAVRSYSYDSSDSSFDASSPRFSYHGSPRRAGSDACAQLPQPEHTEVDDGALSMMANLATASSTASPPPTSNANNTNTSNAAKKTWKTRPSTFVNKLWWILADERNGQIIRWDISGTAIEIVDSRALTVHVLPRHFKSTKFASFQRQLSYFGFMRGPHSASQLGSSGGFDTISTCAMVYSNTFFLRSSPELMGKIERRTNVSTPRYTAGQQQQQQQQQQRQRHQGNSTSSISRKESAAESKQFQGPKQGLGAPKLGKSGESWKTFSKALLTEQQEMLPPTVVKTEDNSDEKSDEDERVPVGFEEFARLRSAGGEVDFDCAGRQRNPRTHLRALKPKGEKEATKRAESPGRSLPAEDPAQHYLLGGWAVDADGVQVHHLDGDGVQQVQHHRTRMHGLRGHGRKTARPLGYRRGIDRNVNSLSSDVSLHRKRVRELEAAVQLQGVCGTGGDTCATERLEDMLQQAKAKLAAAEALLAEKRRRLQAEEGPKTNSGQLEQSGAQSAKRQKKRQYKQEEQDLSVGHALLAMIGMAAGGPATGADELHREGVGDDENTRALSRCSSRSSTSSEDSLVEEAVAQGKQAHEHKHEQAQEQVKIAIEAKAREQEALQGLLSVSSSPRSNSGSVCAACPSPKKRKVAAYAPGVTAALV
jgi:hypothetical protein